MEEASEDDGGNQTKNRAVIMMTVNNSDDNDKIIVGVVKMEVAVAAIASRASHLACCGLRMPRRPPQLLPGEDIKYQFCLAFSESTDIQRHAKDTIE